MEPVPVQAAAGRGAVALAGAGPADADVLDVVGEVLGVVRRMNGGAGLPEVMQAVADGIARVTGFGAVVVNVLRADGMFEVTTTSGPDHLVGPLLGVCFPSAELRAEMALAERWGRLLFLPAGTVADDLPHVFVPDLPAPTEPDGWWAGDCLFAPLYDQAEDLIGVVSVDAPHDGRRPGGRQRQLLELLAGEAELAIASARLVQRLRASEQTFRLAFDRSVTGLALVSLDPADPLRVLQANSAFLELLDAPARGWERLGDLLAAEGAGAGAAGAGAAGAGAAAWCRRALDAADGVLRLEVPVQRGRHERWLAVTTTVLPLHAIDAAQAVVQVEDVTAQREAEVAERAGARDPLTGLPTRAGLVEQVEAVIAAARTASTPGAVVFADLDGFKAVNDHHGHAAGDAVLAACAARLQTHLRAQDFLCRYGGDEFVMVLRQLPPAEVPAVVERIRASVTAPVQHGSRTHRVGISLGWAPVDASSRDAGEVLAAADACMYDDKRGRTAGARG